MVYGGNFFSEFVFLLTNFAKDRPHIPKQKTELFGQSFSLCALSRSLRTGNEHGINGNRMLHVALS